MKKQWILIVVLAALLITGVIIASRSFPDVDQTPSESATQTTPSDTTPSDATEGSFDETFPTVSYEEYQNMSGEDRQAYYEKFSSVDSFNAWLKEAREAYEAHKATTPTIDGDGPINIGDLIGGNNG